VEGLVALTAQIASVTGEDDLPLSWDADPPESIFDP
jgi:hypothetical protein